MLKSDVGTCRVAAISFSFFLFFDEKLFIDFFLSTTKEEFFIASFLKIVVVVVE
jgi:hypothetical protein